MGPGDHNPVFNELLALFKLSFLVLTPHDEQSLANNILIYKLLKQKYTISLFMMQNLKLEMDAWKRGFASFEYNKQVLVSY